MLQKMIKHHLTHWGQVTNISHSKLNIIGSDNGLSPVQHQAIIWTNTGILIIGLLETNCSEILIEIHTFSFNNMHLNTLSAKWQPFCLCLNVLNMLRHIYTGSKVIEFSCSCNQLWINRFLQWFNIQVFAILILKCEERPNFW